MNITLNNFTYCLFLFYGLFFCISPNLAFAQGCSGLGTLNLNVIAPPLPTINAPAQNCDGDPFTVAVNEVFNSYDWSTGASGQSITVNNTGIYTVTVTNTAGCSGTATTNITSLPAATPNITQNTYACNGSITLDAGVFNSYAWSNGGGNGQTATFTSSGTYFVTVTNASGCTGTDNFTVNIPVPPVTSINGNLNFCAGLSTTLTATSGFSSYSWSNGDNTASSTINTGGTYTVTVTDAFGCTDTESVTVLADPSPVPMVNNAEVCIGATVNIEVANAPFQTYIWSTGSTTSSTTVNSPGNYAVTVTAANGCTGVTNALVTPLPTPSPVITQATYTCNGQITLNTAAGFVTYDWSNGDTSPNTTVNSSGTYTITVSNNFGCTGTDQLDVNIPIPPFVNISGDNSLCTGLDANLSATPGLVSYIWSNGDTEANTSVNTGGTYTVTVTDGFGCTATDNIFILEFAPPQPLVTGSLSICDGSNSTFSTTASFTVYNWSNGQSTPSITVNSAGTYTVTVTAANGCTGTDSESLQVLPSPSPNIVQGVYACDNQLLLNTESSYPIYVWSTGESTPNIIVTAAGDYAVTVTNGQGCTGTSLLSVAIPSPPEVEISGENSLCPGNNTTLFATSGFNQYFWSNNSNDPEITVSTAGNYSVTVTDVYGCTTSGDFSVSQLAAPNPNISGPAQICATGNATYSVPGNYTAFVWSTGDITPTITVNTAGTYTVTITATNGCTGTDTQSLTVSANLIPQIIVSPYTCNGQFTLDAGSGYNTYVWGSGETTQSISVGANGDYMVSVSDASGCTGSAVVTASIPAPPMVSISGNNNICAGTSTMLNASPGLSAYIWSDGQVGDSINVSLSGTYTVTATDAFGCTATSTFQLNNNPAPQPGIIGPTVLCSNSSATLTLSGIFGQYLWSTGETSSSISISSGNTYSVTVTDALGCTGTDNQLVTEVNGLNPVVTSLPYTCNGVQTLDAGAGFSTYLWSGGENTPTINVSNAGSYTVTVTDASGCTGTGTLDVSVPTVPQVTITGPLSFCQNANTTMEANPGFVAYNWNTGDTTNTLTTNIGGTFIVTVTDNLGCTDTETVTVAVQSLPQPQIIGPSAVCDGNSATLTLNQNFSTIFWDNGASGESITVSTAGTFTVTVTDGNGCTGIANTTLTINQNPSASIVEEPYLCNGQTTITASAGFITYLWEGPGGFSNNTPQSSLIQSGTYTVTVTDINGCTSSAFQDVMVPVQTQVSLSGPAQFCVGGSVALSASTGFVNYDWSDGSNLPGLTASASGTYTVTATDALGCTSTAFLSVGNFPVPAPTIAGPQAVCPGNNATLSVDGNFTDFNWSTNESTSSITVQPPFTATVTVTDANGCTGTASTTVVVSDQILPNIVALPYACNGQITLDAGSGFPNYNWSNAANTPLIMVTQSGTYTVTVSDGSNCSGTASVQVNVPDLPEISVSGISQICAGQSAELIASSGFVSYIWSNGQSTSAITASQTNTYTVTATDGNGCTASASFVLGSAPPIAPVLVGNTSVCLGSTSIFSISGNYDTYTWSNGESTASITVSIPGNYVVTVTDTNGCSGSAAIDLNLNPSPVPSITGLNLFCPGGSTTLNANPGFSTYIWSSGSSLPSINTQTAGTFTVTVTNSNGCTGTAMAQVLAAPPATVSINGGGVICGGSSATLSATGSTGNFVWSNGSMGNAISVTQSGNYAVTVTDANGCTATDVENVAASTPILTSLNNTTCRIQEAGTQSFTLSAINGCDSVVNIVTTFQATDPGQLELDTEIEASLGESITLNVAGDFQIDSVVYTSTFNLSCSNCLNPSFTATESGFILVTAFDSSGCRSAEEIRITVKDALGIYVPNVFKPGAAENGFFSVFSAASVTSVQNFNVFDRWGNGLFSRSDMPTNDPEAGWDGTFRGQPMQPGVYVYYFEVKLADGSVEVYSGDITIVQ
jgi:hypothetical protein